MLSVLIKSKGFAQLIRRGFEPSCTVRVCHLCFSVLSSGELAQFFADFEFG
jgi:hypothetical protein